MAFRVPIPDVSVVDLTVKLKKPVSLNKLFIKNLQVLFEMTFLMQGETIDGEGIEKHFFSTLVLI